MTAQTAKKSDANSEENKKIYDFPDQFPKSFPSAEQLISNITQITDYNTRLNATTIKIWKENYEFLSASVARVAKLMPSVGAMALPGADALRSIDALRPSMATIFDSIQDSHEAQMRNQQHALLLLKTLWLEQFDQARAQINRVIPPRD